MAKCTSWRRSGSTLVQLTAYVWQHQVITWANVYLFIRKALWHPREGNFQKYSRWYNFENYKFMIANGLPIYLNIVDWFSVVRPLMRIIAVPSDERHGISNHWKLVWFSNSFFNKTRNYLCLMGGIDQRLLDFPYTWASNAENVFKPWRYMCDKLCLFVLTLSILNGPVPKA